MSLEERLIHSSQPPSIMPHSSQRFCLIIGTLFILLFSCGREEVESGEGVPQFFKSFRKSKKLSIETFKCSYSELSEQFDLSFRATHFGNVNSRFHKSVLQIKVSEKGAMEVLDTIWISSMKLYDFMNRSCDSVTSYTTNFHSDRVSMDNYFGDLVITDLNFDGRDDIALIEDGGGNGGPFYGYYIQSKIGKFRRDSFLSDSMTFFPSEINKHRQQLITYVHAGACCVGKHVYQFNRARNSWRQISHEIIRYDD